MNKSVLLLIGVLMLSACSQTCVEKVAITKAGVGAVTEQANIAFEGGLIDLATYEEVDTITDQANLAVSEALPVCLTDESKALSGLRQARQFIVKSQTLMQEDATNELP